MIQCKRAYEPPSLEDGQRILVDRLWPRGCRKDTLALHAWLPDLAPSTALRKAFKGGEIGFATFRQRYRDELAGHPEHWWALLEMAGRGTLTLIYAAQDERQNNARVLAEWLEEEMQRLERPSSPACLAGELDGRINGDG
ncbi:MULTISPECIES: DUF488 domain-containing protein [Stutzerimonas stutzeri subgroup]|uniref:Putative bacteriophage protein n=1 Tax=Stutzerimonas stutzeri CCUG 29243 TaxID=1196835 RepID=I4CPI1_STUST|nr:MULTISPECIES: DUF488 domain-containing protein [Stutzerimonas stutzeri subgroup]AFM31988.1 putative bacteriophage protein [Stutzerimonas stutzeri CCUG 29243]MBU0836088.1 DUF488 domain-containing protein [Gammaproteobacteria bacterium]MBU2331023.1 DUF488 domain-containing protein [Gammaproteobacteria bacterium]MCQ2037726.1 DUF488 domain-containing protein [Stutzerimonas kunmingensis]